jgi:hypothetical protein
VIPNDAFADVVSEMVLADDGATVFDALGTFASGVAVGVGVATAVGVGVAPPPPPPMTAGFAEPPPPLHAASPAEKKNASASSARRAVVCTIATSIGVRPYRANRPSTSRQRLPGATSHGVDLRLTARAYDRSMEERTVVIRFWIGPNGSLAARAIDPHTREVRALEHAAELYRLCFGAAASIATLAPLEPPRPHDVSP